MFSCCAISAQTWTLHLALALLLHDAGTDSQVYSSQVKQWNIDELRGFWRQWYFPANATLYVVGEMGRPTAEVRELISSTFGRVPPGRQLPEGGHAAAGSNGSSSNGNGAGPHASQQQQGALKLRHPVRLRLRHGGEFI